MYFVQVIDINVGELINKLLQEPYIGILIIFVLSVIGSLIAFIVSYFVAPKRPSIVKERRFEAGNPPIDRVRKKLIMQYFGFVFMAVCLECASLYILVLSTCGQVLKFAYLVAMCVIVIVLSLIIGLRYSSRLEEWV